MAGLASAGTYRTERGIEYAEVDGRKLHMTLYVPDDDGEGVRPGMVLVHGGAWILGTRYQQAWYCRQFARNGYVVMTIDYRLMPWYPFPSCLHDCKAAVRWMRTNSRKYRIDPNRIVTFGASAGGHLAALLATTEPVDGLEGDANPCASSQVQACISLYGAVDLTLYRDKPLHGRLNVLTMNFLRDFTGRGVSSPDLSTIESASPLTYARSTSAPTLLVHGTKDSLVHYEQSVRFHEKLQSLGVPSRLISLPGRGHAFDYIHPRERREVFEEMLAFLAEQGCGVHQPTQQDAARTRIAVGQEAPSGFNP